MVNKDYSFKLDIKTKQTIPKMEFVVGDLNTNILNITLTENGQSVDLAGCTVQVVFKKPDGKTVINNCNTSNNVINCILTTQTIVCVGEVTGTISLIYSDKSKVTSMPFKFKVRESLLDDKTVISTNEFSVLDNKIAEVEQLENYVEANEKDRVNLYTDIKNKLITGQLQGTKGEKGDKGERGLQGEKGLQGNKGEKGDRGEQGVKGAKGDKGDKGQDGTGISIKGSLTDVSLLPTTGNTISDTYLINGHLHVWSGSSFVDAGNIQGQKGDKGEKGDQGIQGANAKEVDLKPVNEKLEFIEKRIAVISQDITTDVEHSLMQVNNSIDEVKKDIKDIKVTLSNKLKYSGNFNGATGVLVNHTKGNLDYEVTITCTENPKGYVGDIWIEKAINNFKVCCSGSGKTAFECYMKW